LAKAIKLVLLIKDPKFSVFNLSGGAHSAQDFVNIVKKFIPEAEISLERGKDPNLHPPIMDVTRVKKELGFKPTYTLEDGCEEYINQLRIQFST